MRSEEVKERVHRVESWYLNASPPARIGLTVGGLVLIVIAVPLLVLPGPALLVMFVGLALLAGRFRWMRRGLDRTIDILWSVKGRTTRALKSARAWLSRLQKTRPGALASGLWRESLDDRIGGLAAEVAFFAIFSVFPGLLMLATALGSVDALAGSNIAREARIIIVDFLQRVLTERASGAVETVEELFTQENTGILAAATLVALASLSRGFAGMIRALNVAYDISETRSWFHQRVRALLLALGSIILAILILTMIVTGPMFGLGRTFFANLGLGTTFATVWGAMTIPLALVLSVAWSLLSFHFGPNHRSSLRRHVPGAILAGVLWVCASLGFSLYMRFVGSANELLGALGGGLILMLWLYLLSLGLLVGAEFNDTWAKRRRLWQGA